MKEGQIFTIFMVTWVVLGVGLAVFYWKGKLTAKRQWHPWILVITGLLFVGFVYAMTQKLAILLFVVPAVVLIQLLNYTCTRFCPRCESTLIRNPPWTAMRFCTKCGAALDEKDRVV